MKQYDNRTVKVINQAGPTGFVFFLAYIGAAIYFIQQSSGGVLGCATRTIAGGGVASLCHLSRTKKLQHVGMRASMVGVRTSV